MEKKCKDNPQYVTQKTKQTRVWMKKDMGSTFALYVTPCHINIGLLVVSHFSITW